MSAQRAYQIQPELQPETEVIYLVVPPTPAAPMYAPTPYSLMEKLAIASMSVKSRLSSAGESGLATYAAVMGVGILGYSLYTIKSFLGFDFFAMEHLETFVPIPGYQRF